MKTTGRFLSIVLFFGFSILNQVQGKNKYVNTESHYLPTHHSRYIFSFEQNFNKEIIQGNADKGIFTKAVADISNKKRNIFFGEESESFPTSTCPYTKIFIYHNYRIYKGMHYAILLFNLSNINHNLPMKE